MTIREDFIGSCVSALSDPMATDEVKVSLQMMAMKLALGWIENNSLEFKLYKLGRGDGACWFRQALQKECPQITLANFPEITKNQHEGSI